MAELTAVGYRPGRSFPHRLDPRVKLAAAALLAFGAMGAGPSGLGLLAGVLLVGLLAARISPLGLLVDLRYFPILLASVVLVRGWTVPGPAAFSVAGISFSQVGLREGGLIAGRLGTVAAAGLLLVATTRIVAIRDAIVWLLRPVPGLPEGRVAVMLSLLIRFLPVILFRARETGEVQRARCVERRRNPVYRLRRFSVSLLRRVFLDADALAVAMDARCYSDFRTPPTFRFNRSDGLALALASILAGFARIV